MMYEYVFQKYNPSFGYEDCCAADILNDIDDNVGTRLVGMLFSKGVIDAEEFIEVTRAYNFEYSAKK